MHPSLKKHYVVLALAVVLTISMFLVLNVPFIPTAVEYSEPEQYSELETIEHLANYSSSSWFSGTRTESKIIGWGIWIGIPPYPIYEYYYYDIWSFNLTNVDMKGGVFNVTMKVAGVEYKKFSSYIDAGANKLFNEDTGRYGPYSSAPAYSPIPKPVFVVTPPKIIEQELVNKTRIINKTHTVYKSPLQTLLGT
jgi:hypothetical protein